MRRFPCNDGKNAHNPASQLAGLPETLLAVPAVGFALCGSTSVPLPWPTPGHQAVNHRPYDGPVHVPLAGLFAGCFAGFGASAVDSTGVIAESVKNAASGPVTGLLCVCFADIDGPPCGALFAFWGFGPASANEPGLLAGVRGFVFVPLRGLFLEKIMTCFTLEVETRAGGLFMFDPESDTVKYWVGEGLPNYEGGMEGFAATYPEVVAELVSRKALKKTPLRDPLAGVKPGLHF
jgi:hypothetical protein